MNNPPGTGDLPGKRALLVQLEVSPQPVEGYTDYAGERHPGVRDRVELALVAMSLFSGVELEDYTISLTNGKAPDRVDPVERLRLGVSDTIIKRATMQGKPWTTVTCRRKGGRHA